MAILIYSEQNERALELLTAARGIAGDIQADIYALSINNNEQAEALAAAGVRTYCVENKAVNLADTALMAGVLQKAAGQLEAPIILLASNHRGKELAGRLAQKLDGGCLTDVIGMQVINEKIQCKRNTLGGATIVTQQIESERQVIALAPRGYAAAGTESGGTIQELVIAPEASSVKLAASRDKAGDVVDIEAAEILVVVGQGLEKEDLDLAENIAQKLGGEIACSKPVATDKKWLPEDRIIGLSGKKCKPRLAVILGVSGQVQFTVGIREAHTIVAVNKDENAFILQMADYAMTADLKAILPQLDKALK